MSTIEAESSRDIQGNKEEKEICFIVLFIKENEEKEKEKSKKLIFKSATKRIARKGKRITK